MDPDVADFIEGVPGVRKLVRSGGKIVVPLSPAAGRQVDEDKEAGPPSLPQELQGEMMHFSCLHFSCVSWCMQRCGKEGTCRWSPGFIRAGAGRCDL